MRSLIAVVVAMGCGNDTGLQAVDAAGVGGPPGSPTVMVTGPRVNESFYPAQTATVTWIATDDDPSFTCEVSVLGGASIATGVATTSGATMSVPWAINGLAAGTYQIRVACTDGGGLVGSGVSGQFQISAPPQQVAYGDVQALWNRTCVDSQCHDAVGPQEGLDLTASASYAELVNKASTQCASVKLVVPNAPESSYLVGKLQNSSVAGCFKGSRMPKNPPLLTAAEIQLVRDWIFNGAPM